MRRGAFLKHSVARSKGVDSIAKPLSTYVETGIEWFGGVITAPLKEENTLKDEQQRTCPEGCGTLPECAPLSVPFVPFQQEGEKKYGKTDALAQGTLFPGLNLPFHLQIKGEPVPKTPLSELQALSFVLTELGLYLDTHPEDKEAFQLFQKYAALEKEGRIRYEYTHSRYTRKNPTHPPAKPPLFYINAKENATLFTN